MDTGAFSVELNAGRVLCKIQRKLIKTGPQKLNRPEKFSKITGLRASNNSHGWKNGLSPQKDAT